MEQPLAYIPRIRDYYLALGYETPYAWAVAEDVPFVPLRSPLSQATVSVVTTAAPYQPDKGDQGPGAAYNGAAKFFEVYSRAYEPVPDLRIAHVAIDRDHTTAEDSGSYLPAAAVSRLLEVGEIGGLGRIHGLPTDRSRRRTEGVYAPDILARCREDGADAVLLVANCPVCHQSTALVANILEAAGLPTVLMGCARDIVEHVGVPRFLFSDFPLGNAAGLPGDTESQTQTARLALRLLSEAQGPRSTEVSPYTWPGAADWKLDYSNAARLSPEEIAARRAAFDQAKTDAPAKKE